MWNNADLDRYRLLIGEDLIRNKPSKMNVLQAIYPPVTQKNVVQENAAIFEYAANDMSPLYNRAKQQKEEILQNIFKREMSLIETKDSENKIIFHNHIHV